MARGRTGARRGDIWICVACGDPVYAARLASFISINDMNPQVALWALDLPPAKAGAYQQS